MQTSFCSTPRAWTPSTSSAGKFMACLSLLPPPSFTSCASGQGRDGFGGPHARLARGGVRVLLQLPLLAQPPPLPAWPHGIPWPQRQLQLCRGACRHADMAATPVSTSEPSQPTAYGRAVGGGPITHGWAHLSRQPHHGASTGQTASHLDAFPVGFHTLVGSPGQALLPGPKPGLPAGRQVPLSAKPALSCRKGPQAGAVGTPRQGGPAAGGSAREVLQCCCATPLHWDGEVALCAPWFPSPFPPQGGGGQGFPFHKSEELQNGNPGSQLQNTPWL